jgi:CHAT domain-containing protein
MERFYTNLWDKQMGKLAALREAQLWMLRKRDAKGLGIARGLASDEEESQPTQGVPPRYWAAFVLSGDWR